MYALWYQTYEGERSAYAISKNPETLTPLHNISICNKKCIYHLYKQHIQKIIVSPISCYIYKKETREIELFTEENSKDMIDGSFYAVRYFPLLKTLFPRDPNGEQDVLFYLSKDDIYKWEQISYSMDEKYDLENSEYPEFFYNQHISSYLLEIDTYYEEGILNL
jgi:hypothetical protein